MLSDQFFEFVKKIFVPSFQLSGGKLLLQILISTGWIWNLLTRIFAYSPGMHFGKRGSGGGEDGPSAVQYANRL